ncbi:hypothetical protein AK812_SmicGene25455 [Symbiodinium microadriaticum]|uniref:Uncharacterized protein n=1 Tax=Symbiodinium microadriaticum TaxID=2951 RepID=A0A1Q9DBW6_SYMMI|nr:hypothetical protein AK812_SmicGene25455 [Symbiodinium microadriaticum]
MIVNFSLSSSLDSGQQRSLRLAWPLAVNCFVPDLEGAPEVVRDVLLLDILNYENEQDQDNKKTKQQKGKKKKKTGKKRNKEPETPEHPTAVGVTSDAQQPDRGDGKETSSGGLRADPPPWKERPNATATTLGTRDYKTLNHVNHHGEEQGKKEGNNHARDSRRKL